MDLDLRLVRYFVAVADELHFGRAAARLYISQPALSKQIRKLEDQVGSPLLIRDSRHVVLTARGQRFLDEARQLLAIAQNMQQPARPDVVRIAHVHELGTSRAVADDYLGLHPDVDLLEHALDSNSQLDALLQPPRCGDPADHAAHGGQPSPRVAATACCGWNPSHSSGGSTTMRKPTPHRLLERPLEVFADPPESGSYNAYGDFLTAFEHDLGISMRWLGTPGAFSHCLAHLTRTTGRARSLEFLSYAERYAADGLPTYWPEEAQPYYPWSLAWRSDETSPATTDLLHSARTLAIRNGWLELSAPGSAPPWLPPDDPAAVEAVGRFTGSRSVLSRAGQRSRPGSRAGRERG